MLLTYVALTFSQGQVPARTKATSLPSWPLSRYAVLAGLIAASEEHKIGVSKQLLSVLREVLGLRKAFRTMYELEGQQDDVSNKTDCISCLRS